MIIYKDLLSGDELLSDSYDVKERGMFLEVQGKWITVGDVDIDIGANPSADGQEEEDAGVESTSRKVVDIIDAFRYQETSYDKKTFMAYIKDYMKKVVDKLPADKAEEFKSNVTDALKTELLSRFGELQFFLGESGDMEGSMVYCFYPEGAAEPTFLLFKDALKPVKC